MKKIFTVLLLMFLITGIQAQDLKFGKVSTAEVLEKEHPVEKDANAAVLHRSVTTYYEYQSATGFQVVTEVHERIKIYNKEGLKWANKEISLKGDGTNRERVHAFKASTFNISNGKLVEEKLNRNAVAEEEISPSQSKAKFSFPAVKEGSVIEYQYTVKSPVISSIDDIPLQYTIPINSLEVVTRIPEFLVFEKQLNPNSPLKFSMLESRKSFTYFATDSKRESNYGSGVSASPVSRGTTVSNNVIEYVENVTTIKEKMIPSLKEESYVDNLSNYAAYLSWELQSSRFPNAAAETYSHSWEAVGRSIYRDNDYQAQLAANNYFKNEIDKIISGEPNVIQRAEKIYDFAKSKVKWNLRPGLAAANNGSKVYMSGTGNSGDINLMLTAMLKYAGLNASPVLVSTKENGIPLRPAASGFNYMISAVELGDDIYLLDATDVNAAFGELPARARNWNGLMIRSEEDMAWINLSPKEQAKKRTILNLQVGEDAVKGKSVTSLSGLYSKSYRDDFKTAPTSEQLKKDKGNIVIANLEVENLDTPGTEIKETFSFELKDAVEQKNGKLHLKPMLHLAEKENPFKSAGRRYPITFEYPGSTTHTINIMVPEGYEVESLPESAIYQFKEDAGNFKYLVVQSGKFIKVESVVDFQESVFAPSDYEALRKFYEEIVQKHSEAIVFRKL